MSNLVLSGSLFVFNLLGMTALMVTSKRHSDKFQFKWPLLFTAKSNLISRHYDQKGYMTTQQWLRWFGLLLLLIAFILTCFSPHTGYFIIVWFASLIIAAGSVYLSMVIYEKLI